jgi:hypothetical protein
VSQIVLNGPCGVLLTRTDAWDEMLTIAHQYGWQSQYPEGHYRADIGLQVATLDAYGIACALRDAVEFLIRHETTATYPGLPELVGDICEMIAFCCDGGFRICVLSDDLPWNEISSRTRGAKPAKFWRDQRLRRGRAFSPGSPWFIERRQSSSSPRGLHRDGARYGALPGL